VFLAYYHTGFTEDPPELLDVCDSEETANVVILSHQGNRNRDDEYKPSWWTETRPIRTATVTPATPGGKE
jgi:hypothetical protein